MKYRKKPVVIEAVQWFKHGDHPDVMPFNCEDESPCQYCGARYGPDHGLIGTLESGKELAHLVCPGDWIITGVVGERYPCKPQIFAATYEAVDD